MTRWAVSVAIGYDPRPVEAQGFAVARQSIRRRLPEPYPVWSLRLKALRQEGLYTRPTERREGRLWDVLSDAPMATEFALSRFLVPHLSGLGWCLFVDADVLARAPLMQLFAQRDESKACLVVKHGQYQPKGISKMDGQMQTSYPRKNWSSVVLWNCDHPGTRMLTPELVNSKRGLWLHQFSWLDDKDIGELDPAWNHLVGEHEPNAKARLVHFTNGTPNMPGYENCEFADEWRAELERWAAR